MTEKLSDRLAEMCRTPDGEELPDHAEPWGMDVETVRKCIALARRVEGAPVREMVDAMADTAFIELEAGDVADWAGAGERFALVPVEGGA